MASATLDRNRVSASLPIGGGRFVREVHAGQSLCRSGVSRVLPERCTRVGLCVKQPAEAAGAMHAIAMLFDNLS
jgi:hypothetical protein